MSRVQAREILLAERDVVERAGFPTRDILLSPAPDIISQLRNRSFEGAGSPV
jgi:hypothetical protein